MQKKSNQQLRCFAHVSHLGILNCSDFTAFIFLNSVWRDLSPGHQSQRFGEEGWLVKALWEPPQASPGGRRTLQEGTLENAEINPGCFHLISASHFPWRWYSLERHECGNMGGLSRIWER